MIGYALAVLCVVHLVTPQVSGAYQQCAKNWKARGCRIDDDKGMTTLFDDRKNGNKQIDWNNLEGYVWDLACRCREAALKKRFLWFALENYGICFSGPGPLNNFLKKYPLAQDSNCVGKLKLNKTRISDVDGELCVGGQMRAYFYEITNPHMAGSPIGEAEGEAGEEQASCHKVSDVVIAVDTSGSVGEDNFKLCKAFLQKFVDRYDFTQDKSRLSIITFDSSVYVHLTWKDSAAIGVPNIKKQIDKIKYTGGSTMTQRALDHILKNVVRKHRRPGVPIAVFVMSDGESWNGKAQLPAPSIALRALGCKMIAIGIGDAVNLDELNIITNNKANIFLFKSFANLLDHAAKYLNQLIARACL